jgi:hypothetical protein
MADNQAKPSNEDKISALEVLVTKLANDVSGMVSHMAMRRGDSARPDWDEDEEEKKEKKDSKADEARDDEKAKKDAARDALFGSKKKDSKSDAKRDDEDEDEDKKDAKSDEARDDEDEDEDEKEKKEERDDAGVKAVQADDERRDRKADAKRDDDEDRDDKANSGKRAHWRGDEKRDDWDDDDDKDKKKDSKARDDAAREDARADSVNALRRRIDQLERSARRPRTMSDDELNEIAERQQEWDRVAQMHGLRASRPLDGERIDSYDRRLAKVFQKHSPKWANEDLSQLPTSVISKIIAPEIRADAISAAYRVEPNAGGLLREVRKTDRTGRIISEFVGPVDAENGAISPFRMPSAVVRRINTQPNQF